MPLPAALGIMSAPAIVTDTWRLALLLRNQRTTEEILRMKLTLLLAVLLLPLAVHAEDAPADTGWTGSGEIGFAMTHGNSRSETLNAKIGIKKEDDTWKNAFHIAALRNKGEVTVSHVVGGQEVSSEVFTATANRIEAGGSIGYKLSPRSYVLGAFRYEHDDFASYRWQAAGSVGYGYVALKNPKSELSFEVGPGYKRVQPTDIVVQQGTPPVDVRITPPAESDWIGRGRVIFSHQFNDVTSIQNTFLVEAGSTGRYMQNDFGLVVQMSDKLALKVGHQVRYNSDVLPGSENTDRLLTTNLVYSF